MVVKVVGTPCLQWSSSRPSNDAVSAHQTPWLGTTSKLPRTKSLELKPRQRAPPTAVRRACSASLDAFSDEDFSKRIHDLALKFHLSSTTPASAPDPNPGPGPKGVGVGRAIERQLGEAACCSVKRAFSSMVFIIRELHSFSLQMRELLFYEDLQGILGRVQQEMHASFVWLFQQVFSHTPTFMVYVMILLANFTVHSMGASSAIAAAAPPAPLVEEREAVAPAADARFDGSAIRSFSASIGGSSGGGSSNAGLVGSGMEGDGWAHRGAMVVPDGGASVSGREEGEEEEEAGRAWGEVVEEASRMQGEVRGEALLDRETLRDLVSPVTVKVEGDGGYEDYFRTELMYQAGLAQDPTNVLLLANYAQFLYLVAHDYDRAEEYFKRAIGVEPKDAEAHSKYANFLWQARNDLWAAEETYLEAISADPSNSFYAANYAHFLWSTGGEDTCFPLSSPDDEALDA